MITGILSASGSSLFACVIFPFHWPETERDEATCDSNLAETNSSTGCMLTAPIDFSNSTSSPNVKDYMQGGLVVVIVVEMVVAVVRVVVEVGAVVNSAVIVVMM